MNINKKLDKKSLWQYLQTITHSKTRLNQDKTNSKTKNYFLKLSEQLGLECSLVEVSISSSRCNIESTGFILLGLTLYGTIAISFLKAIILVFT